MIASGDSAIPSELIEYAASDPWSASDVLDDILDDPTHRLIAAVERSLDGIRAEAVARKREETVFVALHGESADDAQARMARIAVLSDEMNSLIAQRRLRLLIEGRKSQRPPPYDQSALADVEPDADGLVPLSLFDIDGMVLTRGNHSFTMVPPVADARNSAYWFLEAATENGLTDRLSIRLDPLMHRPSGEFPPPFFKMWWWGKHLNLAEVLRLTTQEFGRWAPSRLATRKTEFTDYVWSPDGPELTLQLEELPTRADSRMCGSRYVHAIFDRQQGRFIHFDGAVRIFDEAAWEKRAAHHVRDGGKAGVRVKTFRLDGDADSDTVALLCAPYFLWNDDVSRFCGNDVHPLLIGNE